MTTPARTTAAPRWALALTSIGSLLVALDALVVAAAFSTIRAELHAPID